MNCCECNGIIEDKHQHFLIDWLDQKNPACCICYDHLVGCNINPPFKWWESEQ